MIKDITCSNKYEVKSSLCSTQALASRTRRPSTSLQTFQTLPVPEVMHHEFLSGRAPGQDFAAEHLDCGQVGDTAIKVKGLGHLLARPQYIRWGGKKEPFIYIYSSY